ncbi:SCUB1 protein, partial [Atractosteus spatula]|nr:SCUB1 protein [Atractosteus spatula]
MNMNKRYLKVLFLLGSFYFVTTVDAQQCDTQEHICATNRHDCDPFLAMCVEGASSADNKTNYYCICQTGYQGNGKIGNCSDINECANQNGGCSQLCVNTEGSYRCQCRLGFIMEKDNRTCSDINECAQENGGCSQLCVNTEGSYMCECTAGFVLSQDSQTCTGKLNS